jgi:AcrR family transcriptional regulator
MLREGRGVPLATIAAEAGVGVATLYRSYGDREALLHALELRAYGLLNGILDDVDRHAGLTGLAAVGEFLTRALGVGDHLVLPLHGAPPLVTDEAVRARERIDGRLEEFIARGHRDGTIRANVTATDVIVFGALTTQPLTHGPDWPLSARRQLAFFLNGLAGAASVVVPGPPVNRHDVERAFRQRAASAG